MDFLNLIHTTSKTGIEVIIPYIIRIFLIVIGALVVRSLLYSGLAILLKKAAERKEAALQRLQTLNSMMKNVITVFLWGLALILILGEIGIKLGPILAAVGVVGIAIGFGAQSLVKDIFSGFFFLLEGQVRLGDVIEANGKAGVVESITLRLVTIRDFKGNLHIIPHGAIETVTNMTIDFSRAVIEIGIAYREDPEEVMRVLMEEAKLLKEDPEIGVNILQEPEVFGIDAFDDSSLLFKVRFMTKTSQQWNVARVYRRRIKTRFDRENIEIPFPHRTVYWGVDRDGAAPPLHIDWSEMGKLLKSVSINGNG